MEAGLCSYRAPIREEGSTPSAIVARGLFFVHPRSPARRTCGSVTRESQRWCSNTGGRSVAKSVCPWILHKNKGPRSLCF